MVVYTSENPCIKVSSLRSGNITQQERDEIDSQFLKSELHFLIGE